MNSEGHVFGSEGPQDEIRLWRRSDGDIEWHFETASDWISVPSANLSNSSYQYSPASGSATSQLDTQWSRGTSDAPPTPGSGPDALMTRVVDEIPASDPLTIDGGDRHVLHEVDLNVQGVPYLPPMRHYSSQLTDPLNCVLGPINGKSEDYPSSMAIGNFQEYIPRSSGDPWSRLLFRMGDPWSNMPPRIEDPSPSASVLSLAPQPDSFLQTCSPLTGACESGQLIDLTALGPFIDYPRVIDDDSSESRHQLPKTTVGLRPTHLYPGVLPNSTNGMSRSRSMSKTGSQGSTMSTRKIKGGRRPGYRLAEDAAQNAKYMRQHGACWHCFVIKSKCSPGEPCKACHGIANRHGFRTIALPCFRDLKELAGQFFPDALVGHLHQSAVEKFCMDNIMTITRNDFEIRLTIGYGQPFILDAMTFIPADNSELTHGLGVVMNDKGESSRVWHETPFLSIHMVTGDLIEEVDKWLDEILFSNLESWPACYYSRDCFSWQRGILKAICNFFTNHSRNLDTEGIHREEWTGRPKMLRKALGFSILIFVMSHQLLIPEDEKLRLAKDLDIHIPQGTNVSCRLFNKIFKMSLLSTLREHAKDILKELHTSLRSRKDPSDWGFDFSVMILLLTVVGENQISLDDVVACAIARGDTGRSREVDATNEIKTLESNLPDLLMKLFDTKYRSRSDVFNPFKTKYGEPAKDLDGPTQRLVDEVWEATNSDPNNCFFPWPEIGLMHPDQLHCYNVARLLSRFLRPFFESSKNHLRSSVVGRRHRN